MKIRKILPALVLLLMTATLAYPKSVPGPADDPVGYRLMLHEQNLAGISGRKSALPEIYTARSAASGKALFSDLLISESVSPANFVQRSPVITDIATNRIAAAWEDNRSGTVGIYLQLFNNLGTPIGINNAAVVSGDFDLSDPKICADGSGHFYLVWREDEGGLLQAARFDSDANLVSGPFFVSDVVLVSYAGAFDAACFPDGRLVVAWEDYAIGNTIAYRIFNTDGAPQTGILTANSDGFLGKHWSPAVAVNSAAGDEFAIVWEDYRSGTADVFFRLFDQTGSPQLSEFSLSDVDARSAERYLPSLAFNATDGYIAGWIDLRDGENIYLQIVSAAGSAVDANDLLSGEFPEATNWDIDLATTPAGKLLAAWTVYGDEVSIISQRFVTGTTKDGTAIKVSSGTLGQRFTPSTTGDSDGGSAVIWTESRSGRLDIYGTVCDATGSQIRPNFIVNDDDIGSPSSEPAVAAIRSLFWSVAFTDGRRDAGDIMIQELNVGGVLTAANWRVNEDAPGGFQSQPALGANQKKLAVAWTDVRSDGISGQNIFFRTYDAATSVPLISETVVNTDVSGLASHNSPAVAVNRDNIVLIVWASTALGNSHVFGRLFDADDNPLGPDFLIGPAAALETGELPKVSVDSSGIFTVIYLNRLKTGGPAIDIKTVNASAVVGTSFSFSSDQTGIQLTNFDAQVNGDGDVYLAWIGTGAAVDDLFLTVFDAGGAVLDPTFGLLDALDISVSDPSLDIDNEGYVLIGWLDNRTGSFTPFRQIFDPTLQPIQSNTPMYSSSAPAMRHPVVAGFRGQGIFAWADARSNGLNVYASEELYSPTSADDDNPLVPAVFSLGQNFPNPFNPSTTIEFSLSSAGQVNLEIYNILGQKIRTLLDNYYPAGTHEVTWDGTDDAGKNAASGVYLYRLKSADGSKSRSMVLLK